MQYTNLARKLKKISYEHDDFISYLQLKHIVAGLYEAQIEAIFLQRSILKSANYSYNYENAQALIIN